MWVADGDVQKFVGDRLPPIRPTSQSPRVTVIIPTYNWSSVLPYSIRSVLRQTFTDFELLVIGDGCTDDSESVVAGIGDARVRWINLPANTGHQSGPNNEGLRQARGELIAYLGHDDLWLPHHLAAVVHALEQKADIAYTIVGCVSPAGYAVPVATSPAYEPGDWLPPSSFAHRRGVTEGIHGWRDYRELRVDPEQDLLSRAHAAGYRFTAVARLTVIKLPAAQRRDVYRTRPCHEQAEWLTRIESELDFEAVQLGKWFIDARWWTSVRYSKLLRVFVRETMERFRKRMTGSRPRPRPEVIDRARQFKGL